MKRKMYAHKCVGYEGHECGNIADETCRDTRGRKKKRCEDCEREYKRLYQEQYYLTHRGKAQAYQKEYHKQHKRASRRNNNFRAQYANTAKQEQREATRSSYSHSYIMHSSPEKAIKALNKILNGKAELAAVK